MNIGMTLPRPPLNCAGRSRGKSGTFHEAFRREGIRIRLARENPISGQLPPALLEPPAGRVGHGMLEDLSRPPSPIA